MEKKIKAREIAKNYLAFAKLNMPRSVFLLMIFCFITMFISSAFSAVSISMIQFFPPAVLVIQILLLYIIFLMHYGLYLCNLRFVRSQPVALNFLFVGFRQKRARSGAVFFILPTIICILAFLFSSTKIEFFNLPDFQNTDAFLDFIKTNNDSLRKLFSRFALFLAIAFLFYFPFTFVWSYVYDNTKVPFWSSLSKGLKFFRRRILNFLGFEFFCHIKKIFWLTAMNLGPVFIYKFYKDSNNIYSLGSILSFVSFALAFYTATSVILSIQFYYNQYNEDSDKDSSN